MWLIVLILASSCFLVMRCMVLVFLVFGFGFVLDEFRQRIPLGAARHGEEFDF
jgi:hypothetical protein